MSEPIQPEPPPKKSWKDPEVVLGTIAAAVGLYLAVLFILHTNDTYGSTHTASTMVRGTVLIAIGLVVLIVGALVVRSLYATAQVDKLQDHELKRIGAEHAGPIKITSIGAHRDIRLGDMDASARIQTTRIQTTGMVDVERLRAMSAVRIAELHEAGNLSVEEMRTLVGWGSLVLNSRDQERVRQHDTYNRGQDRQLTAFSATLNAMLQTQVLELQNNHDHRMYLARRPAELLQIVVKLQDEAKEQRRRNPTFKDEVADILGILNEAEALIEELMAVQATRGRTLTDKQMQDKMERITGLITRAMNKRLG